MPTIYSDVATPGFSAQMTNNRLQSSAKGTAVVTCPIPGVVTSQADSLGNTGHLSALDATSVTHSIRLDWSHTHNPSFRTTNEKYGQRLPLEQVCQCQRVSQHVTYNAMQCSAMLCYAGLC